MLVLIMAGGKGSRLRMGEKPLVTICGRPMLSYVIDAFESAGHEVVVVASHRTPYTKNWCRARGITLYAAEGLGYVEDIRAAAEDLVVEGTPFFTSVSDLPCLAPDIIADVEDSWRRAGTLACSTWVPRDLCEEHGCRTQYTAMVDDTVACPAGINILTAGDPDKPQEELQLLLHDRRLVFNINTREELVLVQEYLCRKRIP
ncbi:MAG TPA: NTP transferase domain-containing protein [Candidatus Methanoculleus thermohydrogenotrophicum]|jgi:adenosylcobinamide-phosphate guanylyltransferase|nr:NTP transferase domain-containing protein [Candidatus Methanoculleus thermohydrogenotrophicum]NLM82874.1 NTP transferase domain-containing protein [Candidatus Methanoculleus thermohydrogenotrophicum]HOB17903.1 NTP transferase domain-containing protein [Candidatus Methanoculleus thermohydrogenotrophicum]HPZ38038.1 NTP transferase domain-containing protein [Candidatus Methanoculleus thermohydrogenotrophicum]HQC91290.1 NTP transferase domain-containing protein [Candidatus Methanoculleus thermoh